MTNETRNRIRQYTEELPHMKEKVFGALLMLVIATMVTVTSTYAWVTLSRSPEVSHITTSMAANGALEIALSKPDGSQPDEYDIDESLLVDNSVTITNLQWGNLVNLSDASYGIDNMALRPAQLNTTSLLTSPLWGAAYGEDGRITNLDSNYAYAKYNGSQFLTSNEYGVRAIATYVAEVSDATQQAYNEKVQAVLTAHTEVNQSYLNVAPKFSALGTLISKFAQNKLDDGYTDLAPYIADMLPLYKAVSDAMVVQMDAYVALANLQNYLYCNEMGATYVALTWNDLVNNKAQYNTTSADVESSGGIISLVGLTQFISDYNLLQNDILYLEQYLADYKANQSAYYWGGYYQVEETVDGTTTTVTKYDNSVSGYTLSNIVAHLIDYATMTIDLDNDGTETKVVSLGMSNAGSLLNANGQERKVYAYNGILYRFEQSAVDESYRINGKAECTINVTYVMNITVYGKAYTKASGSSYFMENYTATLGTQLAPKDAVAQDTYGLAIDLWVRTNAEQTCLTLEGATSTDEQGNIVSYDGVNRVWGATGEAMLTTDSTTQGGGSCYIYYADTPEDMSRSLELLNAMKVAFVDSTGNLLATAEMDTTNYWAVNGRITVPLVLDNQTKTTYNYVDSMNVEQVGRAITTLYTDLPIRVTAIVYLDGTRLTNDHVLAAAEIQGSLNIQFGSSLELKTLGSTELIDDTRTVTATVSATELDFDTATSDADLTTSITVNVEGVDPSEVTAFFVRAINSTQGTREKTMTFTKQSNGTWACDYVFTAPGTYYLRQVRLDGVDYTLTDPQKVEVNGFGLNSVTWSEMADSVSVQTSDGTHSTTVTVNFASNDLSKLPTSVQARFVRDDGNTVNVPLTYNANGNWVGTGTFTASGTYQLQYLVANGNRYIDLALTNGSYRTMELSLGMYVSVTDLSGGLVQEYDEEEAKQGVYAKKVAVYVYNNADIKLEALENLTLYYSNGTSGTNTISTDLTWDGAEHCYIGTLPIVNPGRYMFSSVTVGGNYLSKCTESPTYIVISPDPPIYDVDTSGCTLNVDGVQYVPLTNDAKIDGIYIENAASAAGSAVVYSAVSGQYYEVSMSYSGSSWYVNLPTYDGTTVVGEDSNGDPIYEQLQDGVWSVAAIYLWDCYAYDEYHDSTNPVLWVDSTLGSGYLATLSGVTADEKLDFSALSTDVSAKVNVSMDDGDTSLGGSDYAFGYVFPVSTSTGMSVTLTDGSGRVIPANKITDVTVNYSYAGNDDTSYGYKVSGYSVTDAIKLNNQDGETGARTVSSDQSWFYVGKYSITSLVVTIGNQSLTYYPGDTSVGVPTAYTVTTAGPTVNNVKLDSTSYKQTVTEFGGTSDNVTGTFLQAYNLDSTNVTIKLVGASDQDMSYAVLDGLTANLILTHQGDSQTYGGYTFSGDTGYQNLSLAMTEKTSGSGTYYAPSSQTLLAGTYKAKMEIAIGGVTETINLKTITVHSMLPDVKITGVSPTTEVMVNKNTDQADNHLTANAETFGPVENQYGDYYAVVYMGYEAHTAESNEGAYNGTYVQETSTVYSTFYANYTAPTVTFTMTDYGVAPLTITVEGNSSDSSGVLTVGTVTEKTYKVTESTWAGDREYSYKGDTASLIEPVTVEYAVSTVGNATYTRMLRNPVSLSQPNHENPTLTLDIGTGVSVSVNHGTTTHTTTTTAIPIAAELTATVTTEYGYHTPVLAEPDGVADWTLVSSSETTKVYTFRIMDDATLTASATKYPVVKFSNANGATVSVTATVDGEITEIMSGDTGVKTGALVTVTATTVREDGYCQPRLTQPSSVTDWTVISEGDFEAKYTFTMPDNPSDAVVSLAAPATTAMYKLTWDLNGALRFVLKDGNVEFAEHTGSYVVPGHELSIRLVATGGINPELDPVPDNVVAGTIGNEEANYTYVMNDDLHLHATIDSYPLVILDNDNYATFKVYIVGDTEPLDYDDDATDGITGVSIKPGRNVRVVLTAANKWYAPRMTQPAEVTENWEVISEGNDTAEYRFTMPYEAVNAGDAGGKCISATAAPTVSIVEGNATATISYTDYAGNQYNNVGSGAQVQPGVSVTVTANEATNYYNPTVSSSDVTLTQVAETDTIYSSITFSFDMISSGVTLETDATAYPTVSYTETNATMSGITNGEQVRPGTTVTVTAAAATSYVKPTVSVVSGEVTEFSGSVGNSSSEYSFCMGTTNVSLAAAGTPTLTWTTSGSFSGTTTAYYVQDGSNVTVNNGDGIPVGSVVYVTVPSTSNAGGGIQSYTGISSYSTQTKADKNVAGVYYFTMPESAVTLTVYQSRDVCISEDTLITLADGSQVRVDSLTGDEELLVWNHVTGQFGTAPIAYLIDHNGKREETEVIHLYFSDGSDLEIIGEHVFYDADSGKYITLTGENAEDYIGNGFAKQNLETGTMDVVTLTDVVFETKVTGVYEVVTYSYMTCFTDGILTASAYIENLLNIFDIDTETMAYDPVKMAADIEKYGLYTYEDLSHIVTEEQFYMHNGPVTKVAVGKGTITHEEMFALVKLFEAYAKVSTAP